MGDAVLTIEVAGQVAGQSLGEILPLVYRSARWRGAPRSQPAPQTTCSRMALTCVRVPNAPSSQ